ncbi:response regulator [Vaginisenegalia massiliensis]|uniref:response regulator n=1 Tax=Vaginisenegalia massiliensis TaxID=2058294 RepID=UPI0013DDECB2|nr:response regulator transcription factor [Vaginisenegalia massiliensis]
MKDFRILLVDDEIGLTDMIKIVLNKEGFNDVYTFDKGHDLLTFLQANKADLILLDVMLPDTDGFSLCQSVRHLTSCPLIFLTARTREQDKIIGFNAGGDDYITKPFAISELVARIKAHYRRKYEYDPDQQDCVLEFGPLKINLNLSQVYLNQEPVNFPAKELELLIFLAQHPQRLFTSQELYSLLWNKDEVGEENTVAVHINRIRKRLAEDAKHPLFIKTVRGIGYKFAFEEGVNNEE